MKLHEYICEKQKTDRTFTGAELARRLGINQLTLSRIRNEKQKPSYALSKAICEITDGMVTFEEIFKSTTRKKRGVI